MRSENISSDIIAMALLYRISSRERFFITFSEIEKFNKIINQNLIEMGSEDKVIIEGNKNSSLFYIERDEVGELYAVINSDADIEEGWQWHVGILPLDVIVASQKENALRTIGLELKDGKFCSLSEKGVSRVYHSKNNS